MQNKEIINIPNAITAGRLLLLPFFLWAVLSNDFNDALIIFAAIALADKLDGVSARLMSQVTEFGKFFDPLVDGVVIISATVALTAVGKLDTIWLFLSIVPIIVNPVAKNSIRKNSGSMPSSTIAKIAMAAVYVAIIAVLINFKYSECIIGISVLLAYIGMFNYLMKAYMHPKSD